MLRIGNIRWKGKCRTHPLYNPAQEGEYAIKGGCPRCKLLLDIFQQHKKMVQMMREFAPRDERPKKAAPEGTQTLLFDALDLT